MPVSLDVNYIAHANQSEEYQYEWYVIESMCMLWEHPTLILSPGLRSKHGPSECLGNIQELCFKHVYPDYHQWFEFDLCLNEKYESIGNGDGLAEDCGKENKSKRVCH